MLQTNMIPTPADDSLVTPDDPLGHASILPDVPLGQAPLLAEPGATGCSAWTLRTHHCFGSAR